MLNGSGRYGVVASRSGERNIQVRASSDMGGGFSRGGAGGVMGGTATLGNYEKDILEGFVNTNSDRVIRRLSRDMFYHDPIAGAAVELQAELPFSDFTLSGLPDQSMLQTYAKSIERLNVKMLLPELTKGYQVDGAFLGTLNFDEGAKAFTSIIPHDLDLCELTPLPIYGRDPLVDLLIPKNIKKLIEKGDPRVRDAFEKYGDDWKDMIGQDRVQLNPEDVLYIPRRTFATTSIGVSLFRRLIPVWLMEKALMRGTIDLAYRRQKAILHGIIGDEEWEPTAAELEQIRDMVLNADSDPTGALMVTRQGIQFNEIRAGADFWRYDEMYDFFSGIKMRALGISEAFLSGDSTYSNMEASLSVFIEQIRSFREMITRKIFYTRLFPLIAMNNDFTVDRYKSRQETTGRLSSKYRNKEMLNAREQARRFGYYENEGQLEYTTSAELHHSIISSNEEEMDLTKLLIPKLQWHKQLKPEADTDYITLLTTLEEKGLPVPLRVYAAAGGLSLPEILTSLDEDIKLRKRVDKYNKQKPKNPQDEANGMFQGASVREKNRNFDHVEMRDPQTGKVLSRKGRSVFNERLNKKAAIALVNLAKKENHRETKKAKEARQRVYSYASANRIFGNTGL